MEEDISSRERVCLERCYFEVQNCNQNDDGTWDCPQPESCQERCRMKSS